jgi:hypothetical protein
LENVALFYGHLEYYMDIWDILWPFGTYWAHLVHFFLFWYHAPWKIWQPCFQVVMQLYCMWFLCIYFRYIYQWPTN